eukprot:CAMPEP_0173293104 /NCGR_PEP_ID=MMETSP1143-20121109/13109_1 /TAXON_ID=483371 /ORGANISM="non described non described, Strain CCMP2298" /LENGTH=139 /DNA_ID=CAMNT_0014232587 /DNA_START=72 /DNA_END=492 /DNA_ORIENTATION=+
MPSSNASNATLHSARISLSLATIFCICIEPPTYRRPAVARPSLPFTSIGGRASTSAWADSGSLSTVVSSTNMPPIALHISLAAMLTTEPMTVYSMRRSDPTVPQYTSPVVMPIDVAMPSRSRAPFICAAADSALCALSK